MGINFLNHRINDDGEGSGSYSQVNDASTIIKCCLFTFEKRNVQPAAKPVQNVQFEFCAKG